MNECMLPLSASVGRARAALVPVLCPARVAFFSHRAVRDRELSCPQFFVRRTPAILHERWNLDYRDRVRSKQGKAMNALRQYLYDPGRMQPDDAIDRYKERRVRDAQAPISATDFDS